MVWLEEEEKSGEANQGRRILVTAALPYANGPLHIGHPRSTYLPSDVYARYCKLAGYETLFVCATDEHGTPIEIKAEKEGLPPLEFVKIYRKKHEEDLAALGIVFDEFYFTDSEENHELAQLIFNELKSKNLVYKKKILQTFCEKCGRVLPDRYVKGDCPKCGAEGQYGDSCENCGNVYSGTELKNPKCAVCGAVPVRKETEHYFFRLSACTEFISGWLKENEKLPSDVVNYLQKWIDEGLQDWDITRDGPYFGIRIPNEENKFLYVWFDAPIGYVSSTLKWCNDHGGDWLKYWKKPETEIVHFIGKDIQYFHFLFWPAMLHFSELNTPTRIPTRGYLNIGADKMSKSRGAFIRLDEFLQKHPPDYLRYYLTAITPNNTSDGSFTWNEFKTKVNSELIDCYGNYVYRVLSFIQNKFNATIPEPDASAFSEEDKKFEEKINSIAVAVGNEVEEINLKEGLEKAIAFCADCNRYFNARAPWHLLKENKTDEAKTVLFLSAKAAFAATLALSPFVPFTAQKIFAQFGAAPKKWGDYSSFTPNKKINAPEIVLHKIEKAGDE